MKRYLKLFKLLFVIVVMMSCFLKPIFSYSGTNESGGSMQNISGVVGNGQTLQSSDSYITTVVPAIVDVTITGSGSVWNSGNAYKDKDSFQTTDMKFELVPDHGYKINKVYWNSNNVTSKINNGVFILDDLENGTISVDFDKNPNKEKKKEKRKSTHKKEKDESVETKETENMSNVVHKPKKQAKFPRTSDENYSVIYFGLVILCVVILFVLTLKKRKISYFID